MVRFTRSGDCCPLVEEVENYIEFIKVTEEMEALPLLERHFPGACEVAVNGGACTRT